MIDAALEWAARGFQVFPLRPRAKEPLTAHGFKDATRGPAVIRDWWRRTPNANIGIATGGGTFVVDLDGQDAKRAWADIRGLNGDVPKTLCTKTGRGWHLFFSAPFEIPNSASLLGQKIDVRGKGGYVVAAPSIHPSGFRYTIAADLPIAPAPRWLIALALPDEPERAALPYMPPAALRTTKGRIATGNQVLGLANFVASAPQGERNARAYWSACRAKDMISAGAVAANSIAEVIVEAAVHAGLPRNEAQRTVHSALRGGGHG